MALDEFAGFGLRGYRSFGGSEIQRIGPTSRIHLIVGRNNVGKSNVLHFMNDLLPQLRGGQADLGSLLPQPFDSPDPWDGSPREVSIALRLTPSVVSALKLDGVAAPLLPVLQSESFSRGDEGVIWLDFTLQGSGGSQVKLQPKIDQLQAAIAQSGHPVNLGQISTALAGTSGGDDHNYNSILGVWQPWRFIPSTHWVDAIREIRVLQQGASTGTRNGQGLIEDLARLQNPDIATHRVDTAKFQALQAFVRSVLDDETAVVQIPDSKSTILVHAHGGIVRPLENLGTGIAEVILLAAVATGVDGHLICIEEPEIHLHPALQRKLIEYLNTETSNHYLISTHSAQLLNAEIASISHLTLEDGWTNAAAVLTPGQLATTVFDLGNRASDLVQSNFVIWVEGPSDRQYIAHWLSSYDSELIEGAHYSIVFYGGALLNHLSADDKETDDLIQLLKINRNLAVVIDSDRSVQSDQLNETKVRVIGELESIGAIAWVTDGYTIENYVPNDILKDAITEEYPNRSFALPSGPYKSPLGRKFTGMASYPSKVRISRRVVDSNRPWSSWPDDLKTQVESLAAGIRSANDMPERA